jgi:hypothetical protein
MCGGGAAGVNRDPPHATGFHQLRGATLPFVCVIPPIDKSPRALGATATSRSLKIDTRPRSWRCASPSTRSRGKKRRCRPRCDDGRSSGREQGERECVTGVRDREAARETHREERDRERYRQRERERERERQTDRQTETDTHTCTHREGFSFVDCQ